MIEPVYPFQRRELHGLERAPGATSMNDLCFVGPLIVSARALSKESPTLPTDGSIPASAKRSVYLIETYWGGFKWSSQRLDEGGCDEEAQAAFGSMWAGAVVVTRSTVGGRTR